MTRTQWVVLIVITILIFVAGIALFVVPAKAPTTDSGEQQASSAPQVASIPDTITVSSPMIGTTVDSPLMVTGEARGPWFFEASFPAKLLDASGKTIAQTPATATGDWMTTDFVPFTIRLAFSAQPSGSKGTLILQNDNPSGDPAKQQTLYIPVVFK